MTYLASIDTEASIWEIDFDALWSCGTVYSALSHPNDTLYLWGNARHTRASVLSLNRFTESGRRKYRCRKKVHFFLSMEQGFDEIE